MNDTLTLRARVDAPPNTVWQALTAAGALRTWLAEHAEVDLPARRFVFWGRSTPDGHEPRQRLQHVDERTIRLGWTLFGTDTTVTLRVEPTDDGTIIEVAQSGVLDHADAVAEQRGLAVLNTFWGLAIGNLVEYLEDRELTPKPDYTSAEQRAELDIAASPEDVYHSLMDPATFQRWFGVVIDVEPKVGGRWAMGGFDQPGDAAKILDLEPARRVRMAWPDGMVSNWELEGTVGRTRLTFVQSGFDEPPHAEWTGWLAGAVELRRFHEVANWRPLWVSLDAPGLPDGLTTVGAE
ncbi:SRPBCC domain-containing protein [Actinophytocola sediminis]